MAPCTQVLSNGLSAWLAFSDLTVRRNKPALLLSPRTVNTGSENGEHYKEFAGTTKRSNKNKVKVNV